MEWLPQAKEWGLKALVEVRTERIINGKEERGLLYYGSARSGTAKQFANWIRGHWGIENKLHYIADVIFEEDASLADTSFSRKHESAEENRHEYCKNSRSETKHG